MKFTRRVRMCHRKNDIIWDTKVRVPESNKLKTNNA